MAYGIKFSHLDIPGCIERAEKLARYELSGSLGYVYRLIDAHHEDGPTINLVAFSIRSITPQGLTIPFKNGKGFKTIFNDRMLRAYAHKDINVAIEAYIRRKKYHAMYLKARYEAARIRLSIASDKSILKTSQKHGLGELPDDFEMLNEPVKLDY